MHGTLYPVMYTFLFSPFGVPWLENRPFKRAVLGWSGISVSVVGGGDVNEDTNMRFFGQSVRSPA